MRNGNPLFIPETSASGANALVAFGKYGAIAYSPFGIERSVSADSELAAAYGIISQMEPVIAAHQGKDSITAVRLNQGEAPIEGFGQLYSGLQLHGKRPCADRARAGQPGRSARPATPPAAATGRRRRRAGSHGGRRNSDRGRTGRILHGRRRLPDRFHREHARARHRWDSASCRKASSWMASGWWCGNSAATISARAKF